MLGRVWDGAMTLAIIGLILFVWFELSGEIRDNTKAIGDLRVEMAERFANIEGTLARLEAAMIREVYTNREDTYHLEQRVIALEGLNNPSP